MFYRHSSSKDLNSEPRHSRLFFNRAPRSSTEATFPTTDVSAINRQSDERFASVYPDRFSNEVDQDLTLRARPRLPNCEEQLQSDGARPCSDTIAASHEAPPNHTLQPSHQLSAQNLTSSRWPLLEQSDLNRASDNWTRQQQPNHRLLGTARPLVPFTHRRIKSEPFDEPTLLMEKGRMMVKSLENEFRDRIRKSWALHPNEHEAFSRWAQLITLELLKLEDILACDQTRNISDTGNFQTLLGLKQDIISLRKQLDSQVLPEIEHLSPVEANFTTAPTTPYTEKLPTIESKDPNTAKTSQQHPPNFSHHLRSASTPSASASGPLIETSHVQRKEALGPSEDAVDLLTRFCKLRDRAGPTLEQAEQLRSREWTKVYHFDTNPRDSKTVPP